jgi:glycyl-tRNA synthetase beta chain
VINGLPTQQQDRHEERKGPRVDAPEQAIDGFLKSTGKTRDQLEVRETPKGQFYFDTALIPGKAITDLIPGIISTVIKDMPWPKNMNWGISQQTWVRPILGGCCVFDGKPVQFDLNLGENVSRETLKITFSGKTVGHRFLAPDVIEVNSFEDYKDKLKKAYVIVDQDERKQIILKQLQTLCDQHHFAYQEDTDLLEEVTGLVEWPITYVGHIDAKFMNLPDELLSVTMRVHQRYFTVLDQSGKLAPFFLVVANIPGTDQGKTIVIGNERVLRARFADADFYYHIDLKKSLSEHAKKLTEYIFHAQLGTMAEKISRIRELTQKITSDKTEQASLSEASQLCKADLVTDLVKEFPELQGIIGSYYAKATGSSEDVCQAIYEQYKLPQSKLGMLLALADRIDTLVGFFAIGIKPTGSKDPFALRRAALMSIRILESQFDILINDLIKEAYGLYSNIKTVVPLEELSKSIEEFFIERLKVYWREQDFAYDYVNAVVAQGLNAPLYIIKSRLVALKDFLKDPQGEGSNLLAGYRRATNIVKIESEKDKTTFAGKVNPALFDKDAESQFYQALETTEKEVTKHQQAHQYTQALADLAKLRPVVDQFFDHVMVNVEDADKRLNRLNLLSYFKQVMEMVADFSQIEGATSPAPSIRAQMA